MEEITLGQTWTAPDRNQYEVADVFEQGVARHCVMRHTGGLGNTLVLASEVTSRWTRT